MKSTLIKLVPGVLVVLFSGSNRLLSADGIRHTPQPVMWATNAPVYAEASRPQYHFTAQRNWLNDANGLVFYQGQYHLFFQHNPSGREWGNMTWGHAASRDLVHWRQLDHALLPDRLGTMFSGSAVVDWRNTAGLQRGPEKTLVLIYTAAGGTSEESKGQPFTQCLAFSNDKGRTWTKYAGNPILKNVNGDNRDPKVFWHEPSSRWIMALYVPMPDKSERDPQGKPIPVHTIQFFSSPNLIDWTYQSRIDGFFECPDLFSLPVEGDPKTSRWIVFAADGDYWIGHFDGVRFVKESGKFKSDWGRNFYAAQTYSDIPPQDGRRILIGWMRGGEYPGMLFNQQMTFPCALSLRPTPDGLRLHKWPVKEIGKLRSRSCRLDSRDVQPGVNPLAHIRGVLLDMDFEVEPGTAHQVDFNVRGTLISWIAASQQLESQGCKAPLPLNHGRLHLRILADRTSLEVFGQQGLVAMSSCYLPNPADDALAFSAAGGVVPSLRSQIRWLRSSWTKVHPR